MNRRLFFDAISRWCGLTFAIGTKAIASGRLFAVQKSEAEWRATLTPEGYAVLRLHGTELPGSSPLDQEFRPGAYQCAGCLSPLFRSETKYQSNTGWPSFSAPIRGAIETEQEYQQARPRTEVHCRSCGGHLGHVFRDGPPPTGERYCINGAALRFVPAAL
jgi:peptide-methionine (R)-S-oxide reductase